MRTRHVMLLTALVAFPVATASAGRAAGTPEQKCQEARYKEAGKYVACQQKVMAKLYGGKSVSLQSDLAKCTAKYTAKWPKLQAKASGTGSACDRDRFEDNGDETVTDGLTGLQWEKKGNLNGVANLADPHDADNIYTWSVAPPSFTAADGTAFTIFLTSLNNASFAGDSDWRLPTIYELQTILLAPYLCTTYPCIDAVFGQTYPFSYWSATTAAGLPSNAWYVYFVNGGVGDDEYKNFSLYVRAVRGGL